MVRNSILFAVSLAMAVLLSSCNGIESPVPQTGEDVFFIRATINSEPFDWTSGVQQYYLHTGRSVHTDNDNTIALYASGIGIKGTLTKAQAYLGLAKNPRFQEVSNAQFLSLYSEGIIPYSATGDVKNFEGVELEFGDAVSQIFWNTIGDQTGSSFVINKLTKTDKPNASNGATAEIEATFNCKLYSTYYPDSVRVVTNGALKLRYVNN